MKLLQLEKPETKPVDTKISPTLSKVYKRTLGSAYSAAEAQRLFNPSMPSTKPKAPTAAQMNAGTTSTMDLGGSWGTPERANG